MQQIKQIRWGIIGLGSIANTFAKDLKLVPNAILQGVASRNLGKATAFKTCCCRRPSFNIYAFCAPIATIKEIVTINPFKRTSKTIIDMFAPI